MLNRLLAIVPRLWANWIALLGTTLATVAGNGILIVVVVDIVSSDVNPYMASFGYLVMPMLFLIGLALVALGLRRENRRRRAGGIETPFGRAYSTVMQEGIHWHVDPDVRIEYEAMDGKRKVIGKVTKTEQGKTTVYLPSKRTGQVASRRPLSHPQPLVGEKLMGGRKPRIDGTCSQGDEQVG